jgi:DNA-binding winged helix-turn-helix (wHTH) protein
MHDPASPARHVRFGAFELDVRSGELHKGPTRLKVPDQSIEILKALLEQPGELITREQLRERLWPSNTFVDFEHGLNAAVRRLRDALGDSADAPHYIETLPRRGYRFIGAVDPAPSASFTNHSDPAAPQLASAVAPKLLQRKAWRQRSVIAVSVACALLVGGARFWRSGRGSAHQARHPSLNPPG